MKSGRGRGKEQKKRMATYQLWSWHRSKKGETWTGEKQWFMKTNRAEICVKQGRRKLRRKWWFKTTDVSKVMPLFSPLDVEG